MKKIRIVAAASLLLLPSMFFSSPGYSTSQLPPIGSDTGQFTQQSCPTGSGAGCFGQAGPIATDTIFGFVFSNADRVRREGISTCLQIMQQFRDFAGGAG